jgi:hypothetical protein
MLLLAHLLACDPEAPASCDLRTEAAALAGDGATDCGEVLLGSSANAAHACTVSAFNAHGAFFALFQEQGIDSRVELAVVSDGTTTWNLLWDSDPSGGSNAGAVISKMECRSPVVGPDDAAGTDTVQCSDFGESSDVCGR